MADQEILRRVKKTIQSVDPANIGHRTGEAIAIAAIKAMREPTDKIIEAAFGKSDLTPHPFRTAWYNMIDAITEDTK